MAKNCDYRENNLYGTGGLPGAQVKRAEEIRTGKTSEITKEVRKVADTGKPLTGPNLGKYEGFGKQ